MATMIRRYIDDNEYARKLRSLLPDGTIVLGESAMQLYEGRLDSSTVLCTCDRAQLSDFLDGRSFQAFKGGVLYTVQNYKFYIVIRDNCSCDGLVGYYGCIYNLHEDSVFMSRACQDRFDRYVQSISPLVEHVYLYTGLIILLVIVATVASLFTKTGVIPLVPGITIVVIAVIVVTITLVLLRHAIKVSIADYVTKVRQPRRLTEEVIALKRASRV